MRHIIISIFNYRCIDFSLHMMQLAALVLILNVKYLVEMIALQF